MGKELSRLAKFVGLLKEYNILNFDIDSFESRLKLQKYVYLAGTLFGMKLNYPFNLYIRGPYSPKLADDYYKLNSFKGNLSNASYNTDKFKKFKDFVSGRTPKELEVIATILYLWKTNERLLETGAYSEEKINKLIVEKVRDLKDIKKDFIEEKLKELQELRNWA
ncbi:MAG: hypothetical protein R6U44_02855 [Archaeoglobaceae archaeon]